MVYRHSIAVGRLLQLAEGESTIGAEENRFDRRRQVGQSCLGSMWIGPKRSFCRTLITERRRSSRTATNVTTASRRPSDSRILSTTSVGPPRRRLRLICLLPSSVPLRPPNPPP